MELLRQPVVDMALMRRLSSVWYWLLKREYLLLGLIVLATFVTHMALINQADVVMFDEVHYVNDARSIIGGTYDLQVREGSATREIHLGQSQARLQFLGKLTGLSTPDQATVSLGNTLLKTWGVGDNNTADDYFRYWDIDLSTLLPANAPEDAQLTFQVSGSGTLFIDDLKVVRTGILGALPAAVVAQDDFESGTPSGGTGWASARTLPGGEEWTAVWTLSNAEITVGGAHGHGDLRPEHPPLGKLILAAGILIFGDNQFGWRFPSVLFGTLGIILVYLICRRLNLPRRTALLATFLVAFENMTWTQAGIAMLDVYSITLMLACFWFYLRKQYPLAAVMAALSALCKLNGAFAIPVIILHWMIVRRDKPWTFLASVILAPLSFAALLTACTFIISHHFVNPWQTIDTMLGMSSTLIAWGSHANTTHPSMSQPWEWVLKPGIPFMPYWYSPHYSGTVSYTVWALIIPAVGFLVYRARKLNDAAIFMLSWFIGTYLVWIPLILKTGRISFAYYFYPTVAAVCIGAAMGLMYLVNRAELRWTHKFRMLMKITLPIFLVLHLAVFVTLTPITGSWYPPLFH